MQKRSRRLASSLMKILIVQNDNGFIEPCVEHEFRKIDDEVGEGEELVAG